ncbi:hypothetical protein JTB14_003197 [Gonioctena quinquepunctata]|nr:hypothetical protein JTB14_003197 [Gonioctena quinquepunctata]
MLNAQRDPMEPQFKITVHDSESGSTWHHSALTVRRNYPTRASTSGIRFCENESEDESKNDFDSDDSIGDPNSVMFGNGLKIWLYFRNEEETVMLRFYENEADDESKNELDR